MRFRHILAVLTVLLLSALPAVAHVGSPDVFVEDNAGPYRLFVTIRVPQVIPGIAEIEIRSETNDVSQIRIAPMQLTGPGSRYAPVADVAQRSKTDPQFFTGSVWLMEFGSLQVRITADGARGRGDLAVPVPAVAQRILPMKGPLEVLLFGLMVLLAFAIVSICAAAVREGSLPPGAIPTRVERRRARVAGVISGCVVIALLFIGGEWWKADATLYGVNVYAPPVLLATLHPGGLLQLRETPARIAAGNPRRAQLSNFDDLIPDHEHLMHFFMIRTSDMASFWHLHPRKMSDEGPGEFALELPASVPAGHYALFADVVLRSGFPVTMVGQIDIPAEQARAETQAGMPAIVQDRDDSGILTAPLAPSATDTMASKLPDGGEMFRESDGKQLRAGVPEMFRFRIVGADGKPAKDLQLYMGMAAHAEIIRSDGSVFAHVHPAGSASMAAMEMAQAALQPVSPGSDPVGRAMPGMAMPGMAMTNSASTETPPLDSEISFPYGFPRPGLYRLFVQIKRSGQIQTGVFDVNVV